MLWRVVQSNDGLPPDAVVCFANTGKEEEATLRFVQYCSERWNVPITWLEWRDNDAGFAVVDFESASRHGEPFEGLIKKRNYLPNPVTRFCTAELKIRTQSKYLASTSLFSGMTYSQLENVSWVGIRADEQRRAIRFDRSRLPLVTAGISKEMVGDFWRENDFDLGLPNMNGVTMHGNCDLCFLKGGNQIVSLIAEKPERAVWWAEMEALALASKPDGAQFRKDRPTYQQMMDFTRDQMPLFADETIPCFCGD